MHRNCERRLAIIVLRIDVGTSINEDRDSLGGVCQSCPAQQRVAILVSRVDVGTKGRNPALFAVQNNGNTAGFMHARVVDHVDFRSVKKFCSYLSADVVVRSDALTELRAISKSHEHHQKVTSPEEAANWLPKVHVVISNLKTFLLGTSRGESRQYMQEYVDEFVYRFKRRWWELQITMLLLQAAVDTRPLHAILN